jgi:hypothetical protein
MAYTWSAISRNGGLCDNYRVTGYQHTKLQNIHAFDTLVTSGLFRKFGSDKKTIQDSSYVMLRDHGI